MMSMAEMLWEGGWSRCVNYNTDCGHRPCTSAQGVFCCFECAHNEKCLSKCKRNGGKKWITKNKCSTHWKN